jgi:hypothetical protein
MTKVKWLIEDYEHDSSLDPLMNEIKSQGMELKVVKYEPWENGEYNQYSNKDCVVFYGTLNLGRQLQREKGWIPGVYCDFKNLCCVTYYSYWGKYLFNQDYIMLPFLEIKRREDYIFDIFGVDNCIFIRPNSGAKPFVGQVLKREDIDKEFKLFGSYAGKPLDQIITIVSSPKVIEKEWRCVVVDKKVIAFSQYMESNKLNIKREINIEAFELADKIAKEDWQPDAIYTLDICKSNGEYSLLEVNSFSCSGLYESVPESIVKEVSRVALREWEEYND